MGDFQGKRLDALTKEEEAFLFSCFENTSQRVSNGETLDEMISRIKEAFNEIITNNDRHSTILLVAHGGTLYHILKSILVIYPQTDQWFINCSISETVFNDETLQWFLKRFNINHLED